ncbi:hypothetical protein D3C71_1612980 [compost metagenome]
MDLVITGPGGYSETIQTALNPDLTYNVTGAALPVGQYAVTATITGTSVSQTEIFQVTAPPPPSAPAPVPSLGAWGVAALSFLLAMVGMVRGRKQ